MRFYTVEIAGREEILVGFRENEAVYRLNLLARLVPELAVADMNELICRYTPEVKAKLERLADNDDVRAGRCSQACGSKAVGTYRSSAPGCSLPRY